VESWRRSISLSATYDAYTIIDLPDNATAAAVSLTANRAGFIASKTIVLMTADEMDQATKKTVEFRPPGR
jgi:uncharacterized protein with GYD domain